MRRHIARVPRRRVEPCPGRRLTPLVAAVALAALAGCAEEAPDAYGNFEADREVVVSAEVGGQLLRLDASEGDRLAAGEVVGVVDTELLALEREELAAQGRGARTRATEARAQMRVLEVQLATAREELARTRRLLAADAATSQQLTQREGEVRRLEAQLEAARASSGVVQQEVGGAAARIARIEEQIRRSRIVNPIGGTVLVRYAEPGELVQRGAPLYRIARLDTLVLRAYVTGSQLPSIRIGAPVRVAVDAGEDALATLPGVVTWVASEAEFTPTPIQTREERADQVYAVRVRVPNPSGLLKIGMPGELLLEGGADGGRAAAGAR